MILNTLPASPLSFNGNGSGCVLAFFSSIRFSRALPAIVAGSVTTALITTQPAIGNLDLPGGGA
jgi:uncharacterized membrane protein